MARGDDMRLTMVMVCADPCLAHAHAHVRDAGRYDTTVGAAGDGWYYYISGSNSKRNRVVVFARKLDCERAVWTVVGGFFS